MAPQPSVIGICAPSLPKMGSLRDFFDVLQFKRGIDDGIGDGSDVTLVEFGKQVWAGGDEAGALFADQVPLAQALDAAVDIVARFADGFRQFDDRERRQALDLARLQRLGHENIAEHNAERVTAAAISAPKCSKTAQQRAGDDGGLPSRWSNGHDAVVPFAGNPAQIGRWESIA
jgi:hypothetical protein